MSGEKKTIAVIDDEPEIRSAMTMLLRAFGYDVETFDSAKTFINCVSTCKVSCLIVDIHLGDICGFDLAYRLASDGFKFPLIFMTGDDDPVLRKKAFASGGIAFLQKPCAADTLLNAIKMAVG